jgi:molybdopterin/thiamine biosynthesis adenylyltransferase
MESGPSLFLNEEQKRRYSRQMMLPEIGEEGQRRLGRAKVLLVGLGGLGSISSYYLAAAGVGCLRIVDRDCVGLENLNRQLLHSTDDLGRPKVESASENLLRLNPACCVLSALVDVEDENALGLAKGCDLIIDGTDNLRTRHVLNRVSLKKRIPFIYGGINGWKGMAATFVPVETGCFACLFPQERVRTNETEFPALGPTAGVIASIQSMEAIRILLGLPPKLAGRLLEFRGTEMRFRTIGLERNPECSECADIEGG